MIARKKEILREHFILVTDGQVEYKVIQECDKIINGNEIQFKYVTTYIIGEFGDLSVGAQFSRNCGNEMIEVKSEDVWKKYIAAEESDFLELDNIDSINSVQMFNEKYSSLFDATKQNCPGTKGDEELARKYNDLLNGLQETQDFDLATKTRIERLTGMATGAIENVFDNAKLTAMKYDIGP